MYILTLESNERKAIGYATGQYGYGAWPKLLMDYMGEDDEWDANGPVTFYVPENVAWELRDKAEEDGFMFPCLSNALHAKLIDWLDTIV